MDTSSHALLLVNATAQASSVPLDQTFLWRLPLGAVALAAISLDAFGGTVVFKDSTVATNLPVGVKPQVLLPTKHDPQNVQIMFRQGGIQIQRGALWIDARGKAIQH